MSSITQLSFAFSIFLTILFLYLTGKVDSIMRILQRMIIGSSLNRQITILNLSEYFRLTNIDHSDCRQTFPCTHNLYRWQNASTFRSGSSRWALLFVALMHRQPQLHNSLMRSLKLFATVFIGRRLTRANKLHGRLKALPIMCLLQLYICPAMHVSHIHACTSIQNAEKGRRIYNTLYLTS